MPHEPDVIRVGTRVELWADFLVDEVQQITFSPSPTGGDFDLTHRGQVAALIPWDATSLDVQEALEQLPNIGVGGVLTYGGPLPGTPVKVRFTGKNVGKRNHPLLTLNAARLTGGSGAVTQITGGGRADPATATLTVDKPDGASATPTAAVQQGVGVWRGTVTPDMEGVWSYTFDATFASFGTLQVSGQFTVAPLLT